MFTGNLVFATQLIGLPAPDGDVFTFTSPQSDPFGPIHCNKKRELICFVLRAQNKIGQ